MSKKNEIIINKNSFTLINLLPYREAIKQKQKNDFIVLCSMVVALNLTIILLFATIFSQKIDYQTSRNIFLEKENEVLDKQIDEIKSLKEQLKTMLARKNVVENLQDTRSDAVNVLNEISKTLPDGMYLKTLRQTGDKLNITGITQSNAKVSTFMISLEQSPWLVNPELLEIKTISLPNTNNPKMLEKVGEFNLNIYLKRKKVDDETIINNKEIKKN